MQLYREEFSVKCKQQLIPEHDVHDWQIVVLKTSMVSPDSLPKTSMVSPDSVCPPIRSDLSITNENML